MSQVVLTVALVMTAVAFVPAAQKMKSRRFHAGEELSAKASPETGFTC